MYHPVYSLFRREGHAPDADKLQIRPHVFRGTGVVSFLNPADEL